MQKASRNLISSHHINYWQEFTLWQDYVVTTVVDCVACVVIPPHLSLLCAGCQWKVKWQTKAKIKIQRWVNNSTQCEPECHVFHFTSSFWKEVEFSEWFSALLDLTCMQHSLPLRPELNFSFCARRLTSFPGSSALERKIEFIRVERLWYFFSRENPQR